MKSKKKIARDIFGGATVISLALSILIPGLREIMQITFILCTAFWAYFTSEVKKEYQKIEETKKSETPEQ